MAISDKIQTLRKKHGWSQQQLAKKMADTFDVTLDFLVDDTGKTAEIKDKAMLNRIMEIQALDTEDQKTIVHVLDSLLRDAKAKKAYAMQ